MIKIVLTNKLSERLLIGGEKYLFISSRSLSKKEINIARKYKIQRYLLKNLNDKETEEFFCEFDNFWNQITQQFDQKHQFWRNVFSTKMQEWEKSFGYFFLFLYSFSRDVSKLESNSIIIICESIEENVVYNDWASMNKWDVSNKYFSNYPKVIVRVLQEVKNFFNFLMIALKLVVKKLFSPKVKICSTNNKRILISTLYYDNCFVDDEYNDHFFGNLEQVFRKKNYEVDYLACPLGNYFQTVKHAIKKPSFFIPYSIISWLDLISILYIMLTRRINIKKAVFRKNDFSAIIRWNMRRFISFFNCDSEVYYIAIQKLCKSQNYEKLIQLYEGNILEKSSIQAFKKYSHGKILGYSHAVLFPLNLKIYQTLSDNTCGPLPDMLVTSGIETKRMLAGFGNYENISIYSGCSLREFPHINISGSMNNHCNTILIALDGTWSCVFLLDWILSNFKQLERHYKIILRGHPNVPVAGLLSQCINSLPDNFSISSNTLEEDLSKCFCTIYRQSSVGLQSIMNGIPAIQVNVDSPLNADPIVNLLDCKWVANSIDDLNRALNEIEAVDPIEKKNAMEKAKKYSKEYFSVADHETLGSFLR